MRYKVPQNIDMEDRIVGPLTMVQFVIVMIGGMIVYVSYLLFTPTSFWFIAIPVALVTLSLAFLKINDQHFPKFAGSTLLFLTRPKSRVWQKNESHQALSITHQVTAAEQKQAGKSSVHQGDLAGLSTVLDTGGTTPIPVIPPTVPVPATPVPESPTATPPTQPGSPQSAPAITPPPPQAPPSPQHPLGTP